MYGYKVKFPFTENFMVGSVKQVEKKNVYMYAGKLLQIANVLRKFQHLPLDCLICYIWYNNTHH